MTVITPDQSEQRLVWTLVAVLTVVLAYALAGATGAGATSVVHWTGVVLLIGGICMAGAGMSGARDERMRLEEQITRVRERPAVLDPLQPEHAAGRQSADAAGSHDSHAVADGFRAGLATLGSRSMRLQGWAVACLIVGTVITAIW